MDIQELTQEAILAIQTNEFEQAIRLFKAALAQARHNLLTENDTNGPVLVPPRHPQPQGMVMQAVLLPAQWMALEERTVNNDFLLFDRVFVPTDQDTSAHQSMACLYNIALCYHLFAFHNNNNNNGSDPTALLRRASYFYRLGINSTGELVADNDAIEDPWVIILYLALLNNHGHIRSYFCEHDLAIRHLQTIYATLDFFYTRNGVNDPVGITSTHPHHLLESILFAVGGGRPASSALAFFCPLRYMARPRTPAAAA